MANYREGMKKDEDNYFLPFQGLNKSVVVQETKMFNSSPLNARKCAYLLTKILYLIHQGETLTRAEATNVFFDATKLFQSNDANLRRMVYMLIKELSNNADQTFVLVNTLCKDMTLNNDIFQAGAIRALRKITEPSMLGAIEKHLKQSLVKDGAVASAALVSAYHIADSSPEAVKKWIGEIQEALRNSSQMAQYHALALLYKLRQNDRLGVSKLVTTTITKHLGSPLAHCLLIKYCFKVLQDEAFANDRSIINYLESCLNHRSEMVTIAAARAMCDLNLNSKDLTKAISVLQISLNSYKPFVRFAAIKTLNKVASTRPLLVSLCNADMETLIADNNRSIATLAITTLLKTSNENSIDRLMKQISTFMNDIQDEFKIVVIDALKTMCLKFPKKYHAILTMLSDALRDEGGLDYKREIVETIMTIVDKIQEAKEDAILQLCEFIEDCEYPLLLQQVLHLLGKEVPKTKNPSRYIRYISNRVILESAVVRASAISALAKIGAQVQKLRPSIIVLIRRCLHDADDEVRDRAIFYLNILEQQDEKLIQDLITSEFSIPIVMLENLLRDYRQSQSQTPFTIDNINLETIEAQQQLQQAQQQQQQIQQQAKAQASSLAAAVAPEEKPQESPYEALLSSIPQLAALGKPFKSSKPVELTEAEIEYQVNCVKHIYAQHIVFQFNITNTVEDQLLENVMVAMDLSRADGLTQEFVIQAPALAYNAPEAAFVCCRRQADKFPLCTLSNTLKFIVKEVDKNTGEPDEEGYEDEYQVEDIELNVSDYIQKGNDNSNFDADWDSLGEETESVRSFRGLTTMKTIAGAVNAIIEFSGMSPQKGTHKVQKKVKEHVLLLSGVFVPGGANDKILAKANWTMDDHDNVSLELRMRSKVEVAKTMLANSIM
eukprot:GEZU01007023.1.p1 GENE.GEZU01007023.1~~GEZU01007023.1.p1  ORF type:complete len:892 (-),score=329.33 GEZU01007023.1:134-2809(-)